MTRKSKIDKDIQKLDYKVYFADSEEFSRKTHPSSVIIVPSADDWNDFSLRTRMTFTVTDEQGQKYKGDLNIGFAGEENNPRLIINNALQKDNAQIISAKSFPKFYTLLPDMQSYRLLMRELQEKAVPLLLLLNDLVAIKEFTRIPPWYQGAINSKVFHLSLIRDSSAFFAFENAASILHGLEKENKGSISSHLFLNFKLQTFANRHQLEFTFERNDLLPNRIAVLIGRNGAGKSQSMRKLIEAALKGNIKRFHDEENQRPVLNKIIGVSSPGETGKTFPRERREGRIPYKRLALGRSDGIKKSSDTTNTLVKLARLDEYTVGSKRWDIFSKAIKSAIDIEELAIKVKPDPENGGALKHTYLKIADLRSHGEKAFLEACQRIYPRADLVQLVEGKPIALSSGQITFINFAAMMCLHIENGSLVLLDEPETHLHPNLISRLVKLLDDLLRRTGSVAIIATHSAYFVREVPRSQVHILKQDDDRNISVHHPRLKTVGAEIGAISDYVFDDDISGSLVERIYQKIKEDGRARKKLLSLKEELPSETLMQLAYRLKIDLGTT